MLKKENSVNREFNNTIFPTFYASEDVDSTGKPLRTGAGTPHLSYVLRMKELALKAHRLYRAEHPVQ